jgi:drug/metabolite transporter (DMT)-like permease
VLIAFVSLFLYFKVTKKAIKLTGKVFFQLIFIGALLGGHWILFFAAIKLSTVPVTLVCLSSITLFTAIFEPLINKTRISKLEIFSGVLIISGIALIFKFESQYTKGIMAALSSALLASIFPIMNSRLVKKHEPQIIGFYELIGAFFWTSLFLLFTGGLNSSLLLKPSDLGYLVLLGSVCTALAYVAGVSVMRELSAFRVALITNLEPVYGILLSLAIFGESDKMNLGFWIGASIILSTIFLYPVAQKRLSSRKQ